MEENAEPELPAYHPPESKKEGRIWYFIIFLIIVAGAIYIWYKYH